MYYYITAIFPFLLFLYRNFDKNYKSAIYRGLFYTFIIAIFIISSCRYYVGTDYESYSDIFNYDQPIEPLYKALQTGIKLIYNKYELLVFIVFTIAYTLKVKVFHLFCYHKGILLTYIAYFSFYYIAYDINAVRQGLALGVTMLAGYYAFQKDFFKYIILIVIASLIHYTAICFSPFYFLLSIKYNNKIVWGTIVLCFILSYINIFEHFINLVESILGGSVIAAKVYNYGTSESFANNILLTFSTVRRLFLFFILYYTLNKLPTDNKLKHFLFVSAFISLIFYLLFSNVGFFAIRMSVYYRIFECIWISYLPYIFKRKSNQLIISIILFIYFYGQIHSALQLENNGLLPIKLFFMN